MTKDNSRGPAPSKVDKPSPDGAPDHGTMAPSRDIGGLLAVMRALRDPHHGCPWDVKQDFASIAPFTIEEAYEVADAIERGDFDDLVDELGDLLLQVVYHAQMASEADKFEFGDVVEAITRKMIRRHPHVFGDAAGLSSDAVNRRWDEIKAEERAEKAARKGVPVEQLDGGGSALAGIPRSLPGLSYALKLQAKAARVGFDWDDPRAVLDKIAEEAGEIVAALDGNDANRIEGEIGDLLFTVANLARHLKVDPENALRRTNAKFETRFRFIEAGLKAAGTDTSAASLDQMEALWQEAKADE